LLVAPRPTPAGTHLVQPGDNLWSIARDELRARRGRASDADVARYWRRVIDANRPNLRSGDPSLIFPGEVVALPPLSGLP
jgi:nucleoid-associated protein YgaU